MDITLLAHLLDLFLLFAIPIGLGFYLTRRFHLGWRLWWIGFAIFILSQVGHIPFNSLVNPLFNTPAVVALQPGTQLIIKAVFLGLSAGLFEELFRYGMFRWWAKDARSWRKGILTGAGHAAAEAMVLVGLLQLITFVQMLAFRDADLTKVVPASQLKLLQQQVGIYWNMGWLAVVPVLERVLTIPIQVCMAVLVLQVFTRRQWWWLLLAILYHALIDFTAVVFPQYIGGYWVEALVAFYAVISLVVIFLLRRPEPPEPAQPFPIPSRSPQVEIKPVEDTPENLEKSRYD